MASIRKTHEIDLGAGRITQVRWSPDGSLLAVPTESGSIVIFETATRRVIRTIGRHDGCVTAVAWDRKAECILTASVDGSVGLWHAETGERAPFMLDGHEAPVHSIEWTDEEAFAITCSPDRLRVLDGACLLRGWRSEDEDRVNNPASFTAASCSRQSTFLLAMCAEHGGLLRIASLVSGDILASRQLTPPGRCLAWSPAGDLLAVGDEEGIWLFRCTQDGFDGVPRRLRSLGTNARALTYSPSGDFIAVADDAGIDIWNVMDGSVTASFPNRVETLERATFGLAFHPAEPLIAATDSRGGSLYLLDAAEAVPSLH
jgi:WD40 repeat protein